MTDEIALKLEDTQPAEITLKMNEVATATPLTTFDVTPTEEVQPVLPPEGHGFSSGVVRAIPKQYRDTSDADIKPSDVLDGKVAYGADGKIVGKIKTLTAQTIVPTTADQVIESGKYLEGDQVIKGDANLIPRNIAEGAEIFGVVGAAPPKPPRYEPGGINFFDYKGNLVASYKLSELPLAEYPEAPEYDGLTFVEWNWTLSEINQYGMQGGADVGANYEPSDGKAHITHRVFVEDLSPILQVGPTSGSMSLEIDWGDGNIETVTATQYSSFPHTYGSPGTYEVVVKPIERRKWVFSNNNSGIFSYYQTNSNANIISAWFPQRVSFGSDAFAVNTTITSTMLTEVVLPADYDDTRFDVECAPAGLSVVFPRTMTNISSSYLSQNKRLINLFFPASMASLGTFLRAGNGRSPLRIPPMVNTLVSRAAQNFLSLDTIILPAAIQSIESYALQGGTGNYTKVLICFAQTPPTIQSNSFYFAQTGYIILVPRDGLELYKAASIWSGYADHIFALEDYR